MKLSVVSCTGNRHEAFALCEKFVERQTLKPFQFIVMDDGDAKTECHLGQQYIFCPEFRGAQSLVRKIDYLISKNLIGGDALVFFEDDDFYKPEWLQFCASQLQEFDLIGEGRAVYYNVAKRWWYEIPNMGHASLCATAVTRKLFPAVLAACQSKNVFLDARLWRDVKEKKKVFDPLFNPNHQRMVVGIKAMPGRVGYGGGHVIRDVNAKDDFNLDKLKELIGDDAALYAPFSEENLKSKEPLPQKVPSHTETGRAHGGNWLKWLNHLIDKPNVVGMELGTFRGESAEFMCENIFTHPTAKYHCVDFFQGSVEHHIGGVDCSTLESDSRARLVPFPQANIIKGYTNEVLKSFTTPLDFAYIDAGHDALNVLRDSIYAFDILKPGGILLWDDYEWSVIPDPLDSPKLAIESFLKIYARKIKVLEPRGWQICCVKL